MNRKPRTTTKRTPAAIFAATGSKAKDPYKEIKKAAEARHYSVLNADYRTAIKKWIVDLQGNPPPPVLPGERKKFRLTGNKWQAIVSLIKEKLPEI